MHQFEGHAPPRDYVQKWSNLHLYSVSQIVDRGQQGPTIVRHSGWRILIPLPGSK